MIWFFQRGTDALRIETRLDRDRGEYVAVLHHPDGTEHTERFKDAVSFRQYLLDTERRLERERWEKAGGPEFLPHGWPDEES